jgi:hypothetical protein
VLERDLSPDFLAARPVRFAQVDQDKIDKETALSDEETAEIEDRLRALGYLG